MRAQISKEQETERQKRLEEEKERADRELRERLDLEYEKSLKWVDDKIQKKNEQREKQKKKRRRIPVIAVCLCIAALAAASGTAAYFITSKNLNESWRGIDGSVALNSTSAPSASAISETPESTGGEAEYELQMEAIFKSYQDGQNGFSCVYPADFLYKDNRDPNVKLLVSDGGATLRVTVQDISNADCKVMMMQYAKEIGGDIIQSRADSGGYILQSRTDSRMYFRKLLSNGSNVIYVDFEYSERAKDAAEYANYIQYISDKFTRL